ncbi:hypothetical protein Afil01_37810 [Actinorhabdospora filicis]|uniref:Uncharacterized protein n=1 Tax=Actinorhabdospora filicis TaxID=1785913 RepID=A0A9W6SL40_9ACTN|nr:hypothetical protein [Actinorhabdospora filicis]GLZ78974.1 hypothetical protein Afil01_37810 [Actinorhabdospora filicis]
MTRTLALLESPAQILNLLEWAHDEDGREIAAAVILPRAEAAREQLRTMSGLAERTGPVVSTFSPRDGARELARCAAVLAGRVARARTLVIGDPFSQLTQALLPLARPERVVIIDDGTATMEFAARLREGRPLTRWHSTARAPARAARATRWLTGRPVELFTSLPVPAPPNVTLTANTYAWARAGFGPPEVTDTVDLLGTSLVETGVVDQDAYLTAVARLAGTHRVDRYLAHRRESPAKLAALAERTGVTVVRPELPLELHARTGPVAATIISFPSTMVHTLPLLLAGSGVRVVIQEVEPSWLAAGASGHASRFLAEVTGSARERHGLATVPPLRSS